MLIDGNVPLSEYSRLEERPNAFLPSSHLKLRHASDSALATFSVVYSGASKARSDELVLALKGRPSSHPGRPSAECKV